MKILTLCLFLLAPATAWCDDWSVTADHINPANYHGVTLANGMIGLVSSSEPLKVKDVVLNGAYDTYGRGRVDNILKGFNFMNMTLDVDGKRIDTKAITKLTQTLDMRRALLVTEFDLPGKLHVKHSMGALRQLPFSALATIELTAVSDVVVTPASVIESPDVLREVKNLYALIDRPHASIGLTTLYARAGQADKAWQLYLKSHRPNQLPPFGVLAETAGGSNPYFATGAGGSLQTLIFGFGGLEFGAGGIVQRRQNYEVR